MSFGLRSPSAKAYFEVLGSNPQNPNGGGQDVSIKLGDTAPDFEAETTEGKIRFHDWIGDSWAVLFSHPKDFTPVCTTELGYMASIKPEFDRRNVKVIGLSVDPMENHEDWVKDIEDTQGHAPNYPIIADASFAVSKAYGMLPADVGGDPGDRTPADNQTVRNVFVIAPDKTVKLILVYPMTTGRNFDEVLRVIDSLQLTAKHKVATPANWQHGDDVIIAGSVSDDEARETYPEGWKSPRPYIRIVPQPDKTLVPVD
jgi:thioredoxin-dependent peroxiredoxin